MNPGKETRMIGFKESAFKVEERQSQAKSMN